ASPAAAANLSFEEAPPLKNARPHTKRLVALVTDIYGNTVADAPVTFSVKSGAVNPNRAVTDARGRVALNWMMGSSATEQTLKGVVRGTNVTSAYVVQADPPGKSRAVAPTLKKPVR